MSFITTYRQLLLFAFALVVMLFFFSASPTQAAPTAQSEAIVTTHQQGHYHTVRPGEYLALIAQQYGVTVRAILNANPHVTHPNLIYSGTVLFIPQSQIYPPPPVHYPPTYGCRYQHYVSYGENLIGIGHWYGISPFAIAEANNIYNLNHIYAGMYLCIP